MVEIWYRTGGVLASGQTTPAISTANGWVLAGSVSVTSTSSTVPIALPLVGMNIPVNPGTPVGFCLNGPSMRYMSYVAGSTTDFLGGGATVKTGPNYGFGGTITSWIATRQFAGAVTFVPAGPCVNPPYVGPAISNKTITCSGENFTLGLDSMTSGTGQNYQWQISSDNINWTNIVGATGPQHIASQTTTNYYRCQVTCGVTVNSASIQITTSAVALPGGTYTINGNLATGGTNFNSFSDFKQAIVCGGIAGPVVVNVISKGSAYNEQIAFGAIGGASATNTITINGGGQTLSFGGGAQYATLLFNGAQHFKIKNLVVNGTGTASCFGIQLFGDARYIEFDSCTVSINAASTGSTTAAFVASGSLTAATTAGLGARNITIKNSVFEGGYYGFTFTGPAAAPYSHNNIIQNNTVRDFYLYGMYISNQDSSIFKGNDVNRAQRTGTITTFYGMFLTGNMTDVQVLGNKIHNNADQNPIANFTAYSLYMSAANATAADPMLVANNAIYELQGTGTNYAIYLASGNFINLYHNTVSLDNSFATTSTSAQRVLFVGASTGTFDIKNNIFQLSHVGTGAKHVVYFSSTVPTFSINNNQYYLNASNGANNFGYYSAANVATFTAWQAVNSGAFDANGVYGDAIFSLNYHTPQSGVGNGMGANLLSIVPTDLYGTARTATPDIGAVEFTPLACLQPSILSGLATSTSVALTWANVSGADSVRVEYGPAGFTQGTGTFVNLTGTSHNFTGLFSQTCYDFYFTSYCGGIIGNGQALYTICTECGAKALPLTENFDNTPTGSTASPSTPTCWKYINSTGSTSVYGYNYNALAPISTPNHWRMYAGVLTSGVLGLVSPALSGLTAGDKRVRFWAKSNTANPTRMFVGTMPNPTQPTSITYIDTIMAPQAYTEFTVNFATSTGYNGTDNYVVFVLGNTATGQSLYIDDIVFEQTPSCNPPIAITAPVIGTTSAQIAWASLNGTSFKLEYGPTGFVQATGQGTIVNPATSPTTLSGLSPNTYYDVYVADNCNPAVWAGPFTFKTNCVTQLSGVYTVGGTPGPTNFNDLDSALAALTGCGITGPVTFNLQGGTHQIPATTFGNIAGVSATNTVTFNGGGVAVDTISFAAGNVIALTFDGAQYITFQNLTINAPAAERPVWMHSGTHHITFNHCDIIGGITTTSSLSSVIAVTATNASLAAAGDNANFITITNCKIAGGYFGLTVYGTSTTDYVDNFVVTDNVFEDQYYYGVRFYYVNNITLERNSIKDFRNSSSYGYYGLYNSNVSIKQNDIIAATYGMYFSQLNVLNATTNSEISNNFVGGGTYGTYLATYNKLNVYHNSIRVNTSGFYGSAPGVDIDIRNNIFVGGTSYAYYSSTNPATGYTLNYNLYHATGTTLAYNAAAYTSLAAWKTAQPTLNVNSLQGNPGFTSTTDFHIIGTMPNGVGFNGLSAVDIDGDVRPAPGSTIVDMGADEYTPLQNDVSLIGIVEPVNQTCGDSNMVVKVAFANLGLLPASNVSATVNVTGAVTTSITASYVGTLPSLGVDTITVSSFNSAAGGSFTLSAALIMAGDQDSGNDSLAKTVVLNDVLPRIPFAALDTVCAGSFDTLFYPSNAAGMTFQWLTLAGDTIGTTDSLLVGPMGANDSTFVLRAVSSSASVGPLDNTIGATANYTAMNHFLQFTVNAATTIYSVDVFANGAGLVDVLIQDGTSLATLYTHTVAVPAGGKQTIVLNRALTPGTYRMGGTTVNNAGGLQRNSSGASYPYVATDGSVTITGNTFSAASYYFFYNWQLGGGGCPRPDGFVTIHNQGSSSAVFASTLNAPTATSLDVDFDASASINATSYDWDFGDGTSGSGATVTHTYLANGTYNVTLIVGGLCGADTLNQTVTIAGIGIEESLIAQTLNVYPNPSNGKFRVEFSVEGLKNVSLRVSSLLGQEIYTSNPGNVSGSYRADLDLSNQATGVYIIQIITDDSVVSRRITIRK